MDTITSLRDSMQAHRGQWAAIARDAGLSYAWVTKFMAGSIPDPRLSTINKLRGALDRRATAKAE